MRRGDIISFHYVTPFKFQTEVTNKTNKKKKCEEREKVINEVQESWEGINRCHKTSSL